MALTIDFARRLALNYRAWDNPLEAPGILLIDEIELNMHPEWQQTVIPHLHKVFPDTQIIVATRSPLVISTLYARQIHVLRDQQIFTPSVQTYGTDVGRVQRLVMDTETRPPDKPRERLDTDDRGGGGDRGEFRRAREERRADLSGGLTTSFREKTSQRERGKSCQVCHYLGFGGAPILAG